jgi:ubiquinone/menaquinone biosynthesis C-methylase UbiE
LDFPSEFFDAVICIGVIDRVKDYDLAIQEMLRVLKSNGRLIISFPNLLSPYAFWRRFVFNPVVDAVRPIYSVRMNRRQPALVSFVRLYTVQTVLKWIARYSVQCRDVIYFNFNIFLPPFDQIFPRSAIAVARRLEKQRFRTMRWLGTGFILDVEKEQRTTSLGPAHRHKA